MRADGRRIHAGDNARPAWRAYTGNRKAISIDAPLGSKPIKRRRPRVSVAIRTDVGGDVFGEDEEEVWG